MKKYVFGVNRKYGNSLANQKSWIYKTTCIRIVKRGKDVTLPLHKDKL